MARLNLDPEGLAFFDIKLAHRDEGVGALADLRVPKGFGRSSLVFHEEFVWGCDASECEAFISGLDPACEPAGVAFLKNERASFSFRQKPGGGVFFEARAIAGFGEITFRMEVAAGDARCFYEKLKTARDAMKRMDGKSQSNEK